MNIDLLNANQFIRHVECLPLTDLEKSLLWRLKCKIELLDELALFIQKSDYAYATCSEHGFILDELQRWEDKLELLSKIENLVKD